EAIAVRGGRRGMKIGPGTGKAGVGGEKGLHPVLILAGQDRAGGIDQLTYRTRGGLGQQRILQNDPLRQKRRGQTPFQLRLPPPGSRTAARRIQQHQVERTGRQRSQQARADDGGIGAGGTPLKLGERGGPYIAGEDLAPAAHPPPPPPYPTPACRAWPRRAPPLFAPPRPESRRRRIDRAGAKSAPCWYRTGSRPESRPTLRRQNHRPAIR